VATKSTKLIFNFQTRRTKTMAKMFINHMVVGDHNDYAVSISAEKPDYGDDGEAKHDIIETFTVSECQRMFGDVPPVGEHWEFDWGNGPEDWGEARKLYARRAADGEIMVSVASPEVDGAWRAIDPDLAVDILGASPPVRGCLSVELGESKHDFHHLDAPRTGWLQINGKWEAVVEQRSSGTCLVVCTGSSVGITGVQWNATT